MDLSRQGNLEWSSSHLKDFFIFSVIYFLSHLSDTSGHKGDVFSAVGRVHTCLWIISLLACIKGSPIYL